MPDSGTEDTGATNAGRHPRREEPGAAMPLEAPPRKAFPAGPAPAVPRRPVSRAVGPDPVVRIAPGADSEGKRLVVGRSLSLIGRIEACEELFVEGTVETDMQRCRALAVARTGVFKGNAEVETADIGGTFEGSLTAGILVMRATAHIRGRVVYGEIEIERGATVIGEMQPRSHDGTPLPRASVPPPD